MHRFGPFSLALPLALVAGCFTAQFDRDASGVFACVDDGDCVEGRVCFEGVCLDDEGPTIRINGPEPFDKYSPGATVDVELHIVGEDLVLDEPGPEDEEGRGYLELEIDGETQATPILSGNLEGGFDHDITLTDPEPGLHRVELRAFRLDGTPYLNPASIARLLIWVDDDQPHVGIASPFPGDRAPVGQPLPIEIVTLNFQFIDPNFAADTIIEGEGHTHVYVDLDYPACLPGCNFDYQPGGSLKPVGPDPAVSVEGELQDMRDSAGPLTLSASLNFTEHFPIPAQDLEDVTWSDDGLYDQLVNETIEIELVD